MAAQWTGGLRANPRDNLEILSQLNDGVPKGGEHGVIGRRSSYLYEFGRKVRKYRPMEKDML